MVDTSNISSLENKEIFIDDLLANLTKKTQKLSDVQKDNYNLLNAHYNLPLDFITNKYIAQKIVENSHSDSEGHSASGLKLTGFNKTLFKKGKNKYAITPKKENFTKKSPKKLDKKKQKSEKKNLRIWMDYIKTLRKFHSM